MKTLVMDTSNNYLAIAFYKDDKLIDQCKIEALKKQSELAIPMMQKMLGSVSLKDIDEMIIAIGPGSYTGVRIALTIAKTLATVCPVKIKAISSLKMLAGYDKAMAIIDARGKKYYVGIYNQGQVVLEDQLATEERLTELKQEYSDYLIKMYDESIDLTKNLYALAKQEDYVENVDALVPCYIKEVEAKKQCL